VDSALDEQLTFSLLLRPQNQIQLESRGLVAQVTVVKSLLHALTLDSDLEPVNAK
jgi:hypothetical protein